MSANCFEATRGDDSEGIDILKSYQRIRQTKEQDEDSRKGQIHHDEGVGWKPRETRWRMAIQYHGNCGCNLKLP